MAMDMVIFGDSSTNTPCFGDGTLMTLVAGYTTLPLTAFQRGCVFPGGARVRSGGSYFPPGSGINARLRGMRLEAGGTKGAATSILGPRKGLGLRLSNAAPGATGLDGPG